MKIIAELYPWLKAAHIISVIAWMAAVFYLPRLFAYHAGTGGIRSPSHETFVVMERRLLQIIATPAMLLTWLFGLMLLMTPGIVGWHEIWPWAKAFGVLAMTLFHFWLARQRRTLITGECAVSEKRFRAMNEIPTALVILIVIMVVVRPF